MIQYERIDDSGEIHNVILYSVSDVAKALGLKIQKKYVGRNTMFKIMKYNHILTRDNQPNQVLINLGLAVFYGVIKHHKIYYMPAFTANGVAYIKSGFASGRYCVIAEKTTEYICIDDVC